MALLYSLFFRASISFVDLACTHSKVITTYWCVQGRMWCSGFERVLVKWLTHKKHWVFCCLPFIDTKLGVFFLLRHLLTWRFQLLFSYRLLVLFDCSIQRLFLGLFPPSWANYFTEFYAEFPWLSAGVIQLMIHVPWKQIALFLIVCSAPGFTISPFIHWELGSNLGCWWGQGQHRFKQMLGKVTSRGVGVICNLE